MNVPMADLQAQHRALKAELTQAFEQVMAACDFGGLGENTTQSGARDRRASAARNTRWASIPAPMPCCCLCWRWASGRAMKSLRRRLRLSPPAKPSAWPARPRSLPTLTRTRLIWTRTRRKRKSRPKPKSFCRCILFGQLADMTRFGADRRSGTDVALLGDAAQAIGATHQGKPLGAWGDAKTLSFYPTKNLGGLRGRRHGADGSGRCRRAGQTAALSRLRRQGLFPQRDRLLLPSGRPAGRPAAGQSPPSARLE